MLKNVSMLVAMGAMIFAAFSSNAQYTLNSYSMGAGGSNTTHSTTYSSQANLGNQANDRASSSSKTGSSGSIGAEQLSVPVAPTLSNNSGVYYNQLQIILNDTAGSSNYPTDVTFAIAVCSGACTTFSYVQTGGTLGASPFYQTYSAWGGASGSQIVGLTPNTTYQAKVAAKEGLFTNTEYGSLSSAVTTANPTIAFSLSPNSLTLSNLLAGTVVTSGTNITGNLTTNGANGATIYVAGQFGGLHSASHGTTITSASTNLATSTSGFGLQDQSVTLLTMVSPFNGSANNVGAETTTYQPIFTAVAPVTAASGTLNVQAKASNVTPAANDYQEVLTFIAAASF